MKRIISRDDLVGAIELKFSISAGQFHRPFISFGTAVAKENSIKAAMLN